MTNRKKALTALLAKVEAGEAKASDMSQAFGAFGAPEEGVSWFTYNAYQGSLDAAKALHDAVLPGWDAIMKTSSPAWVDIWKRGGTETIRGTADNPARAWLIAILKALIPQEGET